MSNARQAARLDRVIMVVATDATKLVQDLFLRFLPASPATVPEMALRYSRRLIPFISIPPMEGGSCFKWREDRSPGHVLDGAMRPLDRENELSQTLPRYAAGSRDLMLESFCVATPHQSVAAKVFLASWSSATVLSAH